MAAASPLFHSMSDAKALLDLLYRGMQSAVGGQTEVAEAMVIQLSRCHSVSRITCPLLKCKHRKKSIQIPRQTEGELE